jgi:cytochrome b involved in lipid metabolism
MHSFFSAIAAFFISAFAGLSGHAAIQVDEKLVPERGAVVNEQQIEAHATLDTEDRSEAEAPQGWKPSKAQLESRTRASAGAEVRTDTSNRDDEGDDDERGTAASVSTSLSGSVQTGSGTVQTGAQTSTGIHTFTMADVAKHATKASCYSAVNGSVYDLTSWISAHPGGAAAIISLCGTDGTAAFMAQHGGQARPEQELASLKIGILK